MNNKYSAYLFFCLLFMGIIYLFSVAKDPLLGDSIIFTLQAYDGFDFNSNATNHILYSNFLALLHKVLPFINIHFLCIGVSVLSGILSLFYLNKLLKLFNISPKSSLICVLILGFSFTFWRVSVITEVYTFYILFVILFLINLFKFLKEKQIKYFYYLSIFLGILFLIHIQTILFGSLYIYFIIKNFKTLRQNIIYGGLITFAIFSLLLIPVILGYHPFINLFVMVSDEDSFFKIDPTVVAKSMIRNSAFFIYNFLFFIIFIYWGVKNKNYLDYIIIAIAPFLFFCIKHDVTDSYVFHLVPYVFILILIGRGLDSFPKISLALPLLLPLFYFVCFKIVENTSYGKTIEKEKSFKGGVRYMFFPALNKNPDLKIFLEKYDKDLLYKKPELKTMQPFVVRWEDIKKTY